MNAYLLEPTQTWTQADQDFVQGEEPQNSLQEGELSREVLYVAPREFYYRRPTVPFSAEDIADYVWEQQQDGASLDFVCRSSALRSTRPEQAAHLHFCERNLGETIYHQA